MSIRSYVTEHEASSIACYNLEWEQPGNGASLIWNLNFFLCQISSESHLSTNSALVL